MEHHLETQTLVVHFQELGIREDRRATSPEICATDKMQLFGQELPDFLIFFSRQYLCLCCYNLLFKRIIQY